MGADTLSVAVRRAQGAALAARARQSGGRGRHGAQGPLTLAAAADRRGPRTAHHSADDCSDPERPRASARPPPAAAVTAGDGAAPDRPRGYLPAPGRLAGRGSFGTDAVGLVAAGYDGGSAGGAGAKCRTDRRQRTELIRPLSRGVGRLLSALAR